MKNASDVSTCLAFARTFKIPFTTRSGGHSYAGWSGTNGLIIDVSNLRAVTVSGSTAVVGAGTRLIDFYQGLSSKGRSVPGGSCPTVGIAGLTLGGGIGVTSRAHGLTCDNVEAIQIVTANGAVLAATADPKHYGDLFWACMGGGGGNFGVVTSFTFKTTAAPQVVLFTLSWPWSQAARVVAAWQSWAPHAPDAMWSNLHLAAKPGGTTPTIAVGGTYLGSVGDAANLLNQLYAKAGSHPSSSFLSNPEPYMNAMLVEAGCSSLGYQACHLPWYTSGGKLSRQPQFAKSDFFTTPLSSAGISTLLAGITALQKIKGGAGAVGGIAFDALGGGGQPGQAGRDRVRAPRRPVLGPVHHRLEDRRGQPRGQQPDDLAAQVLVVDAPPRQRAGLPELHRPRADQLAAGLLRRQLHPPGGDQEEVRPRPPVHLPAGHRRIAPGWAGAAAAPARPAQPALDPAQMLTPASTACRSMASVSSAVKPVRAAAARLSSSWATEDAPTRAEVTRSSRSTQEIASWASDWPRPAAISLSARTWASVDSLSWPRDSEPSRDAREPSGTPFRYFDVSTPCASGENAMQPTPRSPSVPSSSSSTQRLIIE